MIAQKKAERAQKNVYLMVSGTAGHVIAAEQLIAIARVAERLR